LLKGILEVEYLRQELDPVGLDPRPFEQIVEKREYLPGLGIQQPRDLSKVGIIRIHMILFKKFGESENAIERTAEIVRKYGKEFILCGI
jgi:hypothetical protein